MDFRRGVYVSLLLLAVAAVFALAGAVAAGHRDAKPGIAGAAAAAVKEEGPVVHRRVLRTNIENSVLNANRPACVSSCPANGGSYTGRGCSSAYQCRQ
uniref:Uncharacterized protein n=1 Tax=Leersia perrieri TaxID=77586 RepID=A0A0D9W3T8_9ORYZ